jgi:hypothetical protein
MSDLEIFRQERRDALEHFPRHLTEPLLALPKRARQALQMLLDLHITQLVEWRDEGHVKEEPNPVTSLDDMIASMQMLSNLTETESNFDGSDPDYHHGWLMIDAMDPAFPRLTQIEEPPDGGQEP